MKHFLARAALIAAFALSLTVSFSTPSAFAGDEEEKKPALLCKVIEDGQPVIYEVQSAEQCKEDGGKIVTEKDDD